MRILLSLVGIVGSFFLLKYREKLGDVVGEAPWMKTIGGVYNVIIICALFIFLWSIAELTNTTEIFITPFTAIFPWFRRPEPPTNLM